MTMQVGAGGSFFRGLAGQVGHNAILEPLWGANERASEPRTRAGQVTADVGFIVGGAAGAGLAGWKLGSMLHEVPGGLQMRFSAPFTHGPSWPKLALGAAIGAGVLLAASGVKNLFAKASQAAGGEPAPDKDPTPSPTQSPGKPPVDDPGEMPPGSDPVQQPPAQLDEKPVTHTVKTGEYLSFIAKCFDVSWRQLYWANRDVIGSNPDLIRPGQVLVIPSQDMKVPSFEYHPSYTPGVPAALSCPDNSPHAIAKDCPAGQATVG